jgi:hypothetical protein
VGHRCPPDLLRAGIALLYGKPFLYFSFLTGGNYVIANSKKINNPKAFNLQLT